MSNVQYENGRVVKSTLDPSVRKRQRVEKTIVRALVIAGIKAGYTITVDNGEEEVLIRSTDRIAIMREIMSVDEERLLFHKDKKTSMVYLVYGNDGYDVIADHGMSLEPVVDSIQPLIDAFYERWCQENL